MVGADVVRLLFGEGGWSDVTGEVWKWLRAAPGRDSGDLEVECERWWRSPNTELDGEVGVGEEIGDMELCDVEAGGWDLLELVSVDRVGFEGGLAFSLDWFDVMAGQWAGVQMGERDVREDTWEFGEDWKTWGQQENWKRQYSALISFKLWSYVANVDKSPPPLCLCRRTPFERTRGSVSGCIVRHEDGAEGNAGNDPGWASWRPCNLLGLTVVSDEPFRVYWRESAWCEVPQCKVRRGRKSPSQRGALRRGVLQLGGVAPRFAWFSNCCCSLRQFAQSSTLPDPRIIWLLYKGRWAVFSYTLWRGTGKPIHSQGSLPNLKCWPGMFCLTSLFEQNLDDVLFNTPLGLFHTRDRCVVRLHTLVQSWPVSAKLGMAL